MLLVISSMIAIVPMTLIPLMTQNEQFTKFSQLSESSQKSKVVLDGVVDYIYQAIKNRWCFTQNLSLDPDCTLNHPLNLERLLLSSRSIEALDKLRIAGAPIPPKDKIGLNQIEATVNLSSLSAEHPIMRLIGSSKGLNQLSQISVKIARDDSHLIPVRGNEVYLVVQIRFLDKFGNEKMRSQSRLIVFPREIGSFALVLAGDLYLDRNQPPKNGDGAIAPSGKAGEGLRFESPVFVNGDVHIPGESGTFNNTVFVDRLVMGSGKVMSSGKASGPSTAGASDEQLYSSLDSFGGFLSGLQQEGFRDIGLDYLSGKLSGKIPDQTLYKKCLARVEAQTDLQATKESQLIFRSSGDPDLVHMAMTKFNEFVPQDLSTGISSSGDFFSTPSLSHAPSRDTLLRMRVSFPSGQRVDTVVKRGSKVKVEPKFFYGSLNFFENKMEQAERDIEDQEKRIDDLKDDKKDEERDLADEDRDLADLLSEVPPDLSKIDSLKNKIQGIKDKIARITSDLARETQRLQDLQQKLNQAKADFEKAQQIFKNPPTLEIHVEDQLVQGKPQPNQLNLRFNFKNQQFFDEAPSVSIEAFELSYYSGGDHRMANPILYDPNYKRSGHVDFEVSFGKVVRKTALSSDWEVADRDLRTHPVYGKVSDPPDLQFDYSDLAERCEARTETDPSAFGPGDWSISFAPSTRFSWNFADPIDGTLALTDAGFRYGGASDPIFMVRSIVKSCIVKPSANFVSGFFVCDEFTIEDRTEPLRIAGTIITSKLKIPASAVKAGIRWSNIYHPGAVQDLRSAKILKTASGGACTTPDVPIWHPYPDLVSLSEHYRCSPLYLRDQAGPFQWPQVDPDCGLLDGAAQTVCKERVTRFNILEMIREEKI